MKERKPLESRVLTQMRTARGWKGNSLAQALGIAPVSLYEYEAGKKMKPTRPLLERAARVMGFSGSMVDLTFSYVRRADADLAQGTAAGPEHREIRRAAADFGLSWEEFAVFMATRLETRLTATAERRRARELWERFSRKKFTAAQRRALYEEDEEYQSWGLVELLCHASEEAAPDSAERALELAGEALFLARLLPETEPLHRRAEGYAGVHFGNANRVAGHMPQAGAAFDEALEAWRAGASGDAEGLFDEARVLDLEASLRREQRRLPEALGLLERALSADRSGTRIGRILIKRAKTLEEMGRNEDAIATLQEALPKIDAEREPQLVWDLRQNLLVNLARLGRYAEAEPLLEDLRQEAIRLGNRLRLVNVVWLQGTLAAGLGRPEEAEAAFEQVRKEFLARNNPYDATLVSLELAIFYLGQNRRTEVQELTRQLAPVFHAQGISREALATVKLFCEAVQQETITLETAQRFLEDLRRVGA